MEITSLPLLKYTFELFSKIHLKNTLIIGIQHILPTTRILFHLLHQMGLPLSNLHILGKCYSTHPGIFEKLQEEGFKISHLSTFFDSHVSYDNLFQELVQKFLEEIKKNHLFPDYDKVIFLDDGGHLLEEVYYQSLYASNFFGIEQTSAGYNRTKLFNFKFPIINLARSWLKLKEETPLIFKSSLFALKKNINFSEKTDEPILILGNGTIGSFLYSSLKEKHKVVIYDRDPQKTLIAANNLPKAIEDSRIILGCSGFTSISKEFHSYIAPSSFLVSLSSSDREFDASHLRKLIPPDNDCHQHLSIKGLNLLNSGFPINFSNDYSSVDLPCFQITRSLILASIVQIHKAKNFSKKGFQDLEDGIQQTLFKQLLILKSEDHKWMDYSP